MKFISTVGQYELSSVWNMHLTIPDEISSHFLESTGKRVICNIDNKYEFHAAIMPMGDGKHFININKEIRKKLGLNHGDEISITLTPDESKYGIYLPPEMEELLLQDIEGSQFFHALTMGKQRSLLHICGKPKSSDTRLLKSLMVLDYLKSVSGKLDFRELNQYFKDFRDNYV